MAGQLADILSHRPLIIAHRGASARALENSGKALSLALRLGADMVEIDLRLTKDRIPVIFHDEDTRRLSSRQSVISATPYAELRDLPLEGGEKILTLDESLHLIGGAIPLNIEIKCLGGGEFLSNYLKTHHYEGTIIVSSFQKEEISPFLEAPENIAVSALIRHPSLAEIRDAAESGFFSVNINKKYLSEKITKEGKKRNILIFTYTVDTMEEFTRFNGMGVDGFFTNHPGSMISWRGKR